MCSPHPWALSAGGERGCEAEPTPSALSWFQRFSDRQWKQRSPLAGLGPKPAFPNGIQVEFTRQVSSLSYSFFFFFLSSFVSSSSSPPGLIP